MADCLFCKIANKEIPAEVVYEDGAALAFLDKNPLARGHTVVIPKVHADNLLDLPDSLISPVFGMVKKMTEILKSAFNPDAFTIGINHGRMISHVDHLHVHIIPRFRGDGEKSIHSLVNNPPKESLSETRSKILEAAK